MEEKEEKLKRRRERVKETRVNKSEVQKKKEARGGQGGFDPQLRISGVDIPPLFLLIQKLNPNCHETCHQGIINSWLCYSLLGEWL